MAAGFAATGFPRTSSLERNTGSSFEPLLLSSDSDHKEIKQVLSPLQMANYQAKPTTNPATIQRVTAKRAKYLFFQALSIPRNETKILEIRGDNDCFLRSLLYPLFLESQTQRKIIEPLEQLFKIIRRNTAKLSSFIETNPVEMDATHQTLYRNVLRNIPTTLSEMQTNIVGQERYVQRVLMNNREKIMPIFLALRLLIAQDLFEHRDRGEDGVTYSDRAVFALMERDGGDLSKFIREDILERAADHSAKHSFQDPAMMAFKDILPQSLQVNIFRIEDETRADVRSFRRYLPPLIQCIVGETRMGRPIRAEERYVLSALLGGGHFYAIIPGNLERTREFNQLLNDFQTLDIDIVNRAASSNALLERVYELEERLTKNFFGDPSREGTFDYRLITNPWIEELRRLGGTLSKEKYGLRMRGGTLAEEGGGGGRSSAAEASTIERTSRRRPRNITLGAANQLCRTNGWTQFNSMTRILTITVKGQNKAGINSIVFRNLGETPTKQEILGNESLQKANQESNPLAKVLITLANRKSNHITIHFAPLTDDASATTRAESAASASASRSLATREEADVKVGTAKARTVTTEEEAYQAIYRPALEIAIREKWLRLDRAKNEIIVTTRGQNEAGIDPMVFRALGPTPTKEAILRSTALQQRAKEDNSLALSILYIPNNSRKTIRFEEPVKTPDDLEQQRILEQITILEAVTDPDEAITAQIEALRKQLNAFLQ